MVIQLQTSFVSAKAPVIGTPRPGVGLHGANLLAIIALSVFSLAVVLSASVFFFKSHLVRAITDMDTTLAAAKKSFEPTFIEEAARLNARIEGGKELLGSHLAISPLFDVLEKKTLERVRFQDFTFVSTEGREITISMTGQAKSFNSVALQSDVFGAEPSFTNPEFSNFTLNENGDVVFNFKAVVEPSLLRYRDLVQGTKVNEDEATDADADADEDVDSFLFE